MKILITNEEKLTNAITEAEGKATARTVTAKDIVRVLSRITVPKVHLDGTTVHYDGAEHFPNAYKYRPESTHWEAKNVKGKWYVTDVYRATCPNRSKSNVKIVYSDDAKKYILEEASKMLV